METALFMGYSLKKMITTGPVHIPIDKEMAWEKGS